MSRSESLPQAFIYGALGIATIALVITLVTDPSGVWPSILASLIMLGPSVVISGYVITSYSSRRTRKDDTALLSSCFSQIARMITLTDAVINIVNGKGIPAKERDLGYLAIKADPNAPMDLFLAEFESMEKAFNTAIESPRINASDRSPWIADAYLFEFPDFPIIKEFLSRINPSSIGPWSRNYSMMMARWYETATTIIEIGDFGGKVAVVNSTGIVAAKAEAYLQKLPNRRPITLSSAEYLMLVQESLRNCIHLVGEMREELALPKKSVHGALLVALAGPKRPVNHSRVGSSPQ